MYATADRTVVDARADRVDGPARQALSNQAANEVHLDLGDGSAVKLYHFRQGTVAVTRGEAVTAGSVLGRVGNSGRSGWPHLHMEVRQGSGRKEWLPLALEKVRVGLNPVSPDPWARDLEVWEMREGYFVERLHSVPSGRSSR